MDSARRGQSLVEFALVLPILLLLTLGVIDAARVFTANIALTNAVREAAIFGGQGTNYDRWCTAPAGKAPTPAVSVPCPTGTTAAHQANDPANLAYRIAIEATGLDAAAIVLDPPACTPLAACSVASTRVTITAHYTVPTLTPLLGALWGGSITLNPSTTAQILR